jgi:hypothetical protein
MTTKQSKEVQAYSLHDFVQEVLDHVENGWKIASHSLPTFYGRLYVVEMERDASDEQVAKDKAELEKPSRAEILADARAKKAAKKAAAEASDASE